MYMDKCRVRLEQIPTFFSIGGSKAAYVRNLKKFRSWIVPLSGKRLGKLVFPSFYCFFSACVVEQANPSNKSSWRKSHWGEPQESMQNWIVSTLNRFLSLAHTLSLNFLSFLSVLFLSHPTLLSIRTPTENSTINIYVFLLHKILYGLAWITHCYITWRDITLSLPSKNNFCQFTLGLNKRDFDPIQKLSITAMQSKKLFPALVAYKFIFYYTASKSLVRLHPYFRDIPKSPYSFYYNYLYYYTNTKIFCVMCDTNIPSFSLQSQNH